MLAGGARFVWVVRLGGKRRVEIHEPGKPMRLATSGEKLRAPGVLQYVVEVNALYDREAAHKVLMRNLLHRSGYSSLEAVREAGLKEGEELGMRGTIRDMCDALGIPISAAHEAEIAGMGYNVLAALRTHIKAYHRLPWPDAEKPTPVVPAKLPGEGRSKEPDDD